jgi:hypothetical protein
LLLAVAAAGVEAGAGCTDEVAVGVGETAGGLVVV